MSIENSILPQYKPLTLTGYPSCENCLAWSEDGLAIAISGNVHVVEFATNDNQQSSTAVLRADLFTYREWPEKPLATIRHLSIGEEQSLSIVVALTWSPLGLGIHHRPVLTVLTSNLLLSIWETDGSPRNWRRTCVVNHHLPVPEPLDLKDDATETGEARRSSRIRCYTWSHPLHSSTSGKWGSHFLAVLDDREQVTIFRTSKSSEDQYGTWSLVPILTFTLPDLQSPQYSAIFETELQQALTRKASVRYMKFLAWNLDTLSPTSLDSEAQTALVYQRHHQAIYFNVPLQFSLSMSDRSITVKQLPNEQPLNKTISIPLASLQQNLGIVHDLGERPQWRETLKEVVADFDRVNRMGGLYRIRFWAFATSPRQDMEAACVTLHPWDMHEYTSNVLEKCRIVFRPLREFSIPTHPRQVELEAVLTNVLKFVLPYLRSNTIQLTSLDLRLLRVLRAWTVMNETNEDDTTLLDESINHSETNSGSHDQDGESIEGAQTTSKNLRCTEICDICDAPINLDTSSNASICANGHVFSRCNLSLISIQAPRISKYCSQCKRQFLNLSKLKPPPGQCLTTKLYHEFDVCPYCQARFRS